MATRLSAAAYSGDLEAVRALLAGGHANPASKTAQHSSALQAVGTRALSKPCLLTAVQTHCQGTAWLGLLLADGRAEPVARKSGALWIVATHGPLEAMRLLLADGRADPVTALARWGPAPALLPAARWSRRRQWLRAGARAFPAPLPP